MSDAKVKFFEFPAWDVEAAPGKEGSFRFRCPKGNDCGGLLIAGRVGVKRDGQNQGGGRAQWDWNGNREAPTFSPSINCQGCWHGYIREGRCVSTDGVEEPEPKR